MKAAVYTSHGNTSVIEIQDVEIGKPKDNEVKIAVKAFALNRLDVWTRMGMPTLNLKFPHIGASDFAGEIIEIGAEVKNFSIGDRVGVNPTISCGYCLPCRSGKCPDGTPGD